MRDSLITVGYIGATKSLEQRYRPRPSRVNSFIRAGLFLLSARVSFLLTFSSVGLSRAGLPFLILTTLLPLAGLTILSALLSVATLLLTRFHN
jgi:hypothetical protein